MGLPWYDYIEKCESLYQGDIIEEINAPVFRFETSKADTDEEAEVDIYTTSAIVITQSCDILKKRTKLIQLCPCIKMEEFEYLKEFTGKGLTKEKENLRQGLVNGCHMLNKEDLIYKDFLIIDFSNVLSIDKNVLINSLPQIAKRVRLNSPYREKFAQEFGRYFMRIGLPYDIPKFQ